MQRTSQVLHVWNFGLLCVEHLASGKAEMPAEQSNDFSVLFK